MGNIYDSKLTEPAVLDLFGRQGEHRKYFDHDLHDYIGHYRRGRDHRIDLETSEEAPQALKEAEEGIVA
jgi:hypothetical protein